MVDFSILEVTEHLLRLHLVVGHGVHLLDGHGLVDDMHPVYGAVVVIYPDFLSEHLLVEIPDDGLSIHVGAGVFHEVHQ